MTGEDRGRPRANGIRQVQSDTDTVLVDLATAAIDEILHLVREYLEMTVAFVGEFSYGRRIIRYVDGEAQETAVLQGRSDEISDSYCQMIADRSLPPVIPDVAKMAQLRDLAVTAELRLGSYLGVPVHLSDGDLYGTLCCFAHEPREFPDGVQRLLAVAASFIARRLESPEHRFVDVLGVHERMKSILERPESLEIVYQPIVEIAAGRPVGYEALSRFPGASAEPPNAWFADAHEVGLGTELELLAVRRALEALERIPEDGFLALNLSGAVLAEEQTADLLLGFSPQRLVLELTEQHSERGAALDRQLAKLRQAGIRLAVDDLGSGFAGLSRLIELAPDIVKFDRFLTTTLAEDPRRQALLSSTVTFCQKTGAMLIVEGVERQADRAVLVSTGVRFAQGFLFGKPAALPPAPSSGGASASAGGAGDPQHWRGGGSRRARRGIEARAVAPALTC